MEPGITIRILWGDNDLNAVEITLSNGEFAGKSRVYVGLQDLSEMSAELRGFPKNGFDIRKFSFGEFGPNLGGGAISLQFRCGDSAGHLFVDAKLESDFDNSGYAQSVNLRIPTEASAIDAFVNQLRVIEKQRGTAFLASHIQSYQDCQ